MATRQADSHTLVTPNGVEAGWQFDGTTLSFVVAGTTVASFAAATPPSFPIGNTRVKVNPDLAAAGSTVSDAAQLLEGFTVVTGANGTLGVKLPAAPVAGTMVWIKGTTAGVLKVWPDAAATINAIGSNGAMSLASGAIPAIFIAKSSTQWYSFGLVPA